MANPTTNFGWVMPTSASLVTNLPADFNVFGQAVDTSMQYLLGGTTGQILSKTSGTNMAFTWIANDQGDITGVTAGTGISVTSPTGPVPTVAIDATVATLTGTQTFTNKTLTSPALTTPTISTATTNGDLLYGTGSGALARLGIGSASQVLSVSGGIPAWTTPAGGGGKILQVVFASNTTDTNIESTTFTDSGLTATITPTLNTSRIAIFATNQGDIYRAGDTPLGGMRLLRGATALMQSNIDGFFATGSTFGKFSMVQNYVDSPATTSATTYKTQGCGTNVAVRLRFGYDGSTDTIILMEIGA